mgnify:CR=1 FL=1
MPFKQKSIVSIVWSFVLFSSLIMLHPWESLSPVSFEMEKTQTETLMAQHHNHRSHCILLLFLSPFPHLHFSRIIVAYHFITSSCTSSLCCIPQWLPISITISCTSSRHLIPRLCLTYCDCHFVAHRRLDSSHIIVTIIAHFVFEICLCCVLVFNFISKRGSP